MADSQRWVLRAASMWWRVSRCHSAHCRKRRFSSSPPSMLGLVSRALDAPKIAAATWDFCACLFARPSLLRCQRRGIDWLAMIARLLISLTEEEAGLME